jgi:hypothetical protein
LGPLPGSSGTNLEVVMEDQEDRMNKAELRAPIRGNNPEETGLGLGIGGNVKFFVDKTDRILYPPHFICDGPTLWG